MYDISQFQPPNFRFPATPPQAKLHRQIQNVFQQRIVSISCVSIVHFIRSISLFICCHRLQIKKGPLYRIWKVGEDLSKPKADDLKVKAAKMAGEVLVWVKVSLISTKSYRLYIRTSDDMNHQRFKFSRSNAEIFQRRKYS